MNFFENLRNKTNNSLLEVNKKMNEPVSVAETERNINNFFNENLQNVQQIPQITKKGVSGLVNKAKDYTKKEIFQLGRPVNYNEDLFNITDPFQIPDLNTYGTMNHFYKFLRKENTVIESLFKYQKNDNSLLISPEITTDISLQNQIFEALNNISEMNSRNFRRELDVFEVVYPVKPKLLTNIQNRKSWQNMLTTGCSKEDYLTPPRSTTEYSTKEVLTNPQITDFNQILKVSKEVYDAAEAFEKLSEQEKVEYPIEKCPIYFIVKNQEGLLAAHVSVLIYFQGKFYSFGFGVVGGDGNPSGNEGKSTIFNVDPLILYTTKYYKNLNEDYNKSFRHLNSFFKNNRCDNFASKTFLDQEEYAMKFLQELKNFEYFGNMMLDNPVIGLSIIDIGIFQMAHIKRLEMMISDIEKINIDMCIVKVAENGNINAKIILNKAPLIKLKTDYSKFCLGRGFGNSQNIGKDFKDKKKINCTSGALFIFSESIQCHGFQERNKNELGNLSNDSLLKKMFLLIGSKVIFPGNCERIKVVDVKRKWNKIIAEVRRIPLTLKDATEIFKKLYNKEKVGPLRKVQDIVVFDLEPNQIITPKYLNFPKKFTTSKTKKNQNTVESEEIQAEGIEAEENESKENEFESKGSESEENKSEPQKSESQESESLELLKPSKTDDTTVQKTQQQRRFENQYLPWARGVARVAEGALPGLRTVMGVLTPDVERKQRFGGKSKKHKKQKRRQSRRKLRNY
jgi:hypothetical protein